MLVNDKLNTLMHLDNLVSHVDVADHESTYQYVSAHHYVSRQLNYSLSQLYGNLYHKWNMSRWLSDLTTIWKQGQCFSFKFFINYHFYKKTQHNTIYIVKQFIHFSSRHSASTFDSYCGKWSECRPASAASSPSIASSPCTRDLIIRRAAASRRELWFLFNLLISLIQCPCNRISSLWMCRNMSTPFYFSPCVFPGPINMWPCSSHKVKAGQSTFSQPSKQGQLFICVCSER